MSTDLLTRALTEHLDAVTPPPPDLLDVRRRATRRRVGRGAAVGATVVGVVAASTFGLFQLAQEGAEVIRPQQDVAVPGGMDLTDGLRAVEDTGVELHLGGTSVPMDDVWWLSTDGAIAPQGVLYPDAGGAIHLIGRDGRDTLLDAAARVPSGWHPTIKVDPLTSRAVWATQTDDGLRLTVFDLVAREEVAALDVPCGASCGDVVIDGIDGDGVFVRVDDEATYLWSSLGQDDAWTVVGGPTTRVADAKAGTVLYDGAAPTMPDGWRTVRGAVDAQLTHDGRHVLSWSDVLQPVDPATDDPIRLTLPKQATFFSVDTDGSILAATLMDQVYDCEIPSGPCERIVRLSGRGGDPSFIGNDM